MKQITRIYRNKRSDPGLEVYRCEYCKQGWLLGHAFRTA